MLLVLPAFAQTSRFEVGLALYRDGRLHEAIELFKASEEGGEIQPLRQFYKGVCLAKIGRFESASASLVSYLEIQPTDPHGWFWLSRTQLLQKNFVGARHSIQRCLNIQPGSSEANRTLGEIELEMGQNQAAYVAWIKAIQLDPRDSETTYHLGRLFFEADFFPEAATWLRQTLRLDPGHFKAATYLALSTEHLGDRSTAALLYKQGIAQSKLRNSPDSWAYVSYAKLLRQTGKDAEALSVLEESERLCPNASALALLGQILADLGEKRRAEAVYRRGIQLDPALSGLHYRLSLLLRSAGRVEEAQKESALFSAAKKMEENARISISAIRQ